MLLGKATHYCPACRNQVLPMSGTLLFCCQCNVPLLPVEQKDKNAVLATTEGGVPGEGEV